MANSTKFYNVSLSDIYYEGFSIPSEAEETRDILLNDATKSDTCKIRKCWSTS